MYLCMLYNHLVIFVCANYKQDETNENVAGQLDAIMKTGYYHFAISSTGVSMTLKFRITSRVMTAVDHETKAISRIEEWERDEIDEFITKLGFLNPDDTRESKAVEEFIDQNEVCNTMKLVYRWHMCECLRCVHKEGWETTLHFQAFLDT